MSSFPRKIWPLLAACTLVLSVGAVSWVILDSGYLSYFQGDDPNSASIVNHLLHESQGDRALPIYVVQSSLRSTQKSDFAREEIKKEIGKIAKLKISDRVLVRYERFNSLAVPLPEAVANDPRWRLVNSNEAQAGSDEIFQLRQQGDWVVALSRPFCIGQGIYIVERKTLRKPGESVREMIIVSVDSDRVNTKGSFINGFE